MATEQEVVKIWDSILARSTRTFRRPVERTARRIAVDQTNESWVVDDVVVLKIVTEHIEGRHPALDRLNALNEANFTGSPHFWGTQEHDGVTTAYVVDYIPHAEDGWTWAVREAALRLAADSTLRALRIPLRESRPFGHDLGKLVASMHAITTHGDLHVGNILRVNAGTQDANAMNDGRLYVIDFDGNPTRSAGERRTQQPPEYDIAGMLVSLEAVGIVVAHYTQQVTDQEAQDWSAQQSRYFLESYLETPGVSPLDVALVDKLARDQVYRELDYATRHLPRWRYVPEALMRRRGWSA